MNDKTCTLDALPSLAEEIIVQLKSTDVVLLTGALGAGKTTLVRAIAERLKTEDIVSSPTFTLINEYDILFEKKESTLRHADLYRLEDENAVYELGLMERVHEDGITFVEWGEKARTLFNAYKEIRIKIMDENTRRFSFVNF